MSDDNLNSFTPRAQQVIALARKEADRFHHNFVGTEHLLLGLIKLGQGVAVNVLQKMGLDLDTVRAEVEKEVKPGPPASVTGNIPLTPRPVHRDVASRAEVETLIQQSRMSHLHTVDAQQIRAEDVQRLSIDLDGQPREDAFLRNLAGLYREQLPTVGATESPAARMASLRGTSLEASLMDREMLLAANADPTAPPSPAARPACRSPSTCPRRRVTIPTIRAPGARSARWVSPYPTWATCARCSRRSRSVP